MSLMPDFMSAGGLKIDRTERESHMLDQALGVLLNHQEAKKLKDFDRARQNKKTKLEYILELHSPFSDSFEEGDALPHRNRPRTQSFNFELPAVARWKDLSRDHTSNH